MGTQIVFLVVASFRTGRLFSLVHSVIGCCFSPDGKKILSCSHDDTLKLWHATDGTLLQTLNGHTWCVLGCCFSLDGKKILSCSDDHTLKLWHATDGTLLQTLYGHTYRVFGCCFSPDGKKILSCSDGGTLKLWHATDGGEPPGPDVRHQHTAINLEKQMIQAAQLPRLSVY
ncbi:unnamed protein product [Prorocentrum cordatum]|uniref:Uncharacterized protein n=1 Tax=Prorocentrum cordatum TaxID=2364126 RepID=A0ABN9U104_9DINO|nr:unnamed protein product [Polarella glacialis]